LDEEGLLGQTATYGVDALIEADPSPGLEFVVRSRVEWGRLCGRKSLYDTATVAEVQPR
jgi:hypothetical protein